MSVKQILPHALVEIRRVSVGAPAYGPAIRGQVSQQKQAVLDVTWSLGD